MNEEHVFSYEELEIALKASLQLQEHYAILLNTYDEGKRRTFKTIEEWINRLREIGEIKQGERK